LFEKEINLNSLLLYYVICKSSEQYEDVL